MKPSPALPSQALPSPASRKPDLPKPDLPTPDLTRPDQRRLATFLLLAVVAVWGSTFVLVKTALADASPLLFNLLRMVIASAVLIVVHRRSLLPLSAGTLRSGVIIGTLLAAGYQLQTVGLVRTTAIKSAFITGLVVVFVPLLSFFRACRPPHAPRPGANAVVGAFLAFAGLFLLSTPAGTPFAALWSTINLGDLLTLGCALAFAGHLLSIARATHLRAAQLATLQIIVATLVMALTLPLAGHIHLHLSALLIAALLVTGILATAAAFSIQTWAQQHVPATTTALLFTLEPVFALLVSLLFLAERLSTRSALGALLILAGIAITELLSPASPLPILPL